MLSDTWHVIFRQIKHKSTRSAGTSETSAQK